MIHNNILYILLLIVLIFLIIYKNKHFYLEGYRLTWANMAKNDNRNGTNYYNYTRNQCEDACKYYGCKGYVTTTTGGKRSQMRGNCTIFKSTNSANNTDFNETNLQGFKYSKGSYVYII